MSIDDALPLPPWHNAVLCAEPVYLLDTEHFTQDEVESVLRNLTNHKASGMDGVT